MTVRLLSLCAILLATTASAGEYERGLCKGLRLAVKLSHQNRNHWRRLIRGTMASTSPVGDATRILAASVDNYVVLARMPTSSGSICMRTWDRCFRCPSGEGVSR